MARHETLGKIVTLLDDERCPYTLFEHEPYGSTDEAAEITGVPLEQAAKSLLYATMGGYVLAVLPAVDRVSSGKLRRATQSRDVRMASPDVVEQVMGCVVGTCHPIGRLAGIRTIVDPKLAERDVVSFSAGSPTHTITMQYADYERIALPEVVDICVATSPA